MVAGPDGDVPVVFGPAIHRQGGWALQLPWNALDATSAERQLHRAIQTCRGERGCEPRFSPASTKPATPSWEQLDVDGAR
jgi:hypothetical protein